MRYAVVNNDTNVVVNVIMWDGANWSAPANHRIVKSDDCGIGDIWMESIQEFVRPMSRQKPPESPESIALREREFQEAKAILKTSILSVNPNSGQMETL